MQTKNKLKTLIMCAIGLWLAIATIKIAPIIHEMKMEAIKNP